MAFADMQLAFHHSVPKQFNEPELNEDFYLPSHTTWPGPFVLSDGASESYDARAWSRIVVTFYRKQSRFDHEYLTKIERFYVGLRDPSLLSWSQLASFERGSFATLLGLHVADNGMSVGITAIGDSLAAFGSRDEFRSSFPYSSPEQFAAKPLLISTRPDRNTALLRAPQRFQESWNLFGFENVTVMAMTDALGAWLLTEPSTRFGVLARMRDAQTFAKFIEDERARGQLRRDDSTLLVLKRASGLPCRRTRR
jgi:hypothetical protein